MIIDIQNISKNFGTVHALRDVSLAVAAGENLAIVGESGSGKSTLAKVIMGLTHPDAGQIIVDRTQLQMVFQDPYGSLDPMCHVRSILKEAFWRNRSQLTAQDMQERMQHVLDSVGLPVDTLSRFPHEFSGGERQRIAIARALLAKPQVLIFDEAVSALDVLVARQILNLLKQIKQEFGLTYIFISHNLRVVRDFSDKIAIMQEGKIVESGDSSVVFKQPAHPYTRQLLSAAFDYV